MLVTEVGDATGSARSRAPIGRRGRGRGSDAAAAETRRRSAFKRKLTISKELTPLQIKLKNLADLISNVGYIAAVAIFLALLGRGIVLRGPERDLLADPGPDAARGRGKLLNYFVYMVIIIVVAVPEGLPMSVTVSLALAMRKMTRANSLVRHCGLRDHRLGDGDLLGQNRHADAKQDAGGARYSGTPRSRTAVSPQWSCRTNNACRAWQPLDWIVLNAALNSTANLEEKQGKLVTVGNSTEGALLQWLHEAGLDYRNARCNFRRCIKSTFPRNANA